MKFNNIKSTFIKIDELKINAKYITINQPARQSTPQILTIDEIYYPLQNKTYNILNLYWWDLRSNTSPEQPFAIHQLQNSLILGEQQLCYLGFSGKPLRSNPESRIQYMIFDSKVGKLLLYELNPDIVGSKMQRETKDVKFTFSDDYNVTKISLNKDMNPKSAAYGHFTDHSKYNIIIESDPLYDSEGSSSYLSVLSKEGEKTKELWRSKDRMASVLHMEIADIDGDGLDEIIIQPISEIYSENIVIYKWINSEMKQIVSNKVSSRGYQWCIADVDNDNVYEIITMGQSPEEEDTLVLGIYKYDQKEKKLKQILKRKLGSNKKYQYYDFSPIGVTEINGKWKIVFAFNYSTWNGVLVNKVMFYYLEEVTLK